MTNPSTDNPANAGPASPAAPGDVGARRAAQVLLVMLLVGGLLRVALAAWFQGEPLYIWDEQDYNKIARNLVEHGEFAFEAGQPTSLRPPLYPAVVAAVYGLFGVENFQAVRLLQAGLGLLTVLVVYGLGA